MNKIKVISSTLLLLGYTIPFIIPRNNVCYCDYDFIDLFYSSVLALGVGGYLIADSYKLNKGYKHYTLSAGIYFVILSLIFIFDTISDSLFKTYWYVVFNTLTTLLCYASLLYMNHFTRR